MSLIRDAEIENTLRTFATPLFAQTGADPNAIKIHIVNTKDVNAFVADGLNMFIYTGLIIKTRNAGELIGVIAHESGHIAGGHLIHFGEAQSEYTAQSIAAMLLGLAAGIAAKNGQATSAIVGAGQDIAARNFLSFSRMIEGSADTAALRFLDNLHQSSQGFLDFMETLMGQEALLTANQDPYVRTHPLTRDRIEEIRHHVETSPWSKVPVPPEYNEMHRRMVAKLIAFLDPPVETLQRYKESDTSVEARYARAIAYYRIPDLGHALPLVNGLIAQFPNDPYFHELKGQMLYENTRVQEAIPEYVTAARLLPRNALIAAELGQVEVESEDPTKMADAAEHLKFATQEEPDDAGAWRLLSSAYNRLGQDALSEAALAEYTLRAGRWNEAIFHAQKAEEGLKRGTPVALRMEDVRVAAQQARDRAKENGGNGNGGGGGLPLKVQIGPANP